MRDEASPKVAASCQWIFFLHEQWALAAGVGCCGLGYVYKKQICPRIYLFFFFDSSGPRGVEVYRYTI